uniref:Uncharacterized protein n=1 Tax=Rhizophora mucronata TaxID=61149 RepID=A0A2P2Q3J1_RHIMU
MAYGTVFFFASSSGGTIDYWKFPDSFSHILAL